MRPWPKPRSRWVACQSRLSPPQELLASSQRGWQLQRHVCLALPLYGLYSVVKDNRLTYQQPGYNHWLTRPALTQRSSILTGHYSCVLICGLSSMTTTAWKQSDGARACNGRTPYMSFRPEFRDPSLPSLIPLFPMKLIRINATPIIANLRQNLRYIPSI